MAVRVEEITIGVDVARRWLDIAGAEEEAVQRIANTPEAIEAWLQSLNGCVRLGVEPTGSYHEALIRAAAQAGHRVYLIDPLRLSRYREAVGQRAKTDRTDARLLRRYLLQEAQHLRPWRAGDLRSQRLWQLLKRRAAVVRAQTQLRQSLHDLAELKSSAAPVFRQMNALLRRIDQQLLGLVRELGWSGELKRLQSVPGIGPLNAIGLLGAYHRGQFTSADCFVAYLGLDVRVRDSGLHRGRRKLSKKGEPELRRLLYNAAMTARRGYLREYYQRAIARGMSGTAALVALARKLVRLAFALLRDGSEFDATRRACMGT